MVVELEVEQAAELELELEVEVGMVAEVAEAVDRKGQLYVMKDVCGPVKR